MMRHGMIVRIVVMNDGGYGSEVHKLRSQGFPLDGAVFGHSDLAALARGFGVDGKNVTDLADIPKLVAAFADSGTLAVWDFHVSDQVLSPIMRRTHPPRSAQA